MVLSTMEMSQVMLSRLDVYNPQWANRAQHIWGRPIDSLAFLANNNAFEVYDCSVKVILS